MFGVQVLSPAVQPRALWLAAHHAPLGAALDSAWAGLLRALADALSGNEEAVHARRLLPFNIAHDLASVWPSVGRSTTAFCVFARMFPLSR